MEISWNIYHMYANQTAPQEVPPYRIITSTEALCYTGKRGTVLVSIVTALAINKNKYMARAPSPGPQEGAYS